MATKPHLFRHTSMSQTASKVRAGSGRKLAERVRERSTFGFSRQNASIKATLRFARKRIYVSLGDLKTVYGDQKIPMICVQHIKADNRNVISSGFLIDADDWERRALQPINSPQSLVQDDILGGEDMLTLDQVLDISKAAGRSSVYLMETSNRIFGILPPGRLRGKRYPDWQFLAGIRGEPLRRILTELEPIDSWGKYQFFVSAYPELGHISPIEVLTGDIKRPETATKEARALIEAPHDKRLELVAELADEYAHPS